MKLYAELETGAECERLAPTLVALASGTATSEALLELRPHLRNCAACRATVRQLHASRLRRLTAFLPFGALVAPARAVVERFRGGPRRGSGGRAAADGAVRATRRGVPADERGRGGGPAGRAVGGGDASSRLSLGALNLRGWVEVALQRLQSSDVAMSVHAAASGGGGRVTSIAALIGVCVSGVGAGTYCVATALLPDPKPVIRAEAKPAKKRSKRDAKAARRAPERGEPSRTHLARVVSAPAPQRNARTAACKPHWQEQERTVAPDEFSFEASATAASATTQTRQSASGSPSNGSFESGASASSQPASGGEFSDGGGGEFSP